MNRWQRFAAVFLTGGLILVWWAFRAEDSPEFVSQEWLDTYHGTAHEDQRKLEQERA